MTDIAAADPTERPKATKPLDRHALNMLTYAEGYLRQRENKLARQLKETFSSTFLGVAQLLRLTRNDAGHPALPTVDRERCFVTLQLYPDYRGWVLAIRRLLPLP